MKIILIAIMACGLGNVANAQCDKELTLLSSTTQYLNGSGEVTREVKEKTTIDITKTTISIEPEHEHRMEGKIESQKCEWKVPFKEGSSEYHVSFNGQDGAENITIRIDGRDGKLSFLVSFDNNDNKQIRVWPDTFEEKK